MPVFKKDIKYTARSICNGNLRECFSEKNFVTFLSCVSLVQDNPHKLWQAEHLLLALWFCEGVHVNRVLRLTTKDIKLDKHGFTINMGRKEKYHVSLQKDGHLDPFAQKLWSYLGLWKSLSLSSGKNILLFPHFRGRYKRKDGKGYRDYSRGLRYHLRRWLKNYNTKVGSVN